MGDPRKLNNKYETPKKVWDKDRIQSERKLKTAYGLKTAREVWGTLQHLKKARRNAIRLLSLGKDGEEKGKPLLARLSRLGVLSADAKLEDVLAITVENFLERRLQTRVMKKGLARTANQARQLVTHGFISIKGRKVTIPSYMVTVEEEQYLSYFKPIDVSIREDAPKEHKAPAASQEPPSDAQKAE